MLETKQAREFIDSVDLGPIINRLVKVNRWSKYEATKALHQYKNYLFLIKKYPRIRFVPSQEIDEVWHAHILHTKDYINFCNVLFGQYLQHDPQLPLEGQSKADTGAYEQVQELYRREFGTYIYSVKLNFLVRKLLKLQEFFFTPKKELSTLSQS